MTANSRNPALDGPIVASFLYYALFSTIGLIAITTASLVDGAFVGNFVGADALAVISLLVPYFTLLIALALMLAIGGSVTAGKFIGAGKTKLAAVVFSQSLIAVLIVTLSFALLSYTFESHLFQLLKIPTNLEAMCAEYFGVIRWVLVIQLFTMVLYYFVRADGHPKLATAALVCGAVMNIFLDAWLVVYLQKGLRGAAYATAISQTIQVVLLSRYFFSKSRTLQFSARLSKTQWSLLWKSAYNGVSEFINEVSVALIFLLLNYFLIAKFGVAGVAAFSIANYFIFLSIMLSYGIADSLHLVASQNLGAGNAQRIEKFLITALCCTLAIGLTIALVLLQRHDVLISLFVDGEDADVADLSVKFINIIWPVFLVNGTNIILSCYLTAIQRPRPSAIIAIARGLVLPACLLCTFYLLSSQASFLSGGNFLAALPLAECLTLAIAITLFYRHKPNLLLSSKNVMASN